MSIKIHRSDFVPGPSIWGPVHVSRIDLSVAPGGDPGQIIAGLQIYFGLLDEANTPVVALPLLPGTDRADVAELFGWTALNLLRRAGAAVTFADSRPTACLDHFTVAVEAISERSGTMAAKLAAVILNELLQPRGLQDNHVRSYFAGLCSRVIADLPSGPSRPIAAAALRRGIPVTYASPDTLLELGNGKYRKWLRGSVTSNTSHIAFQTCNDKYLTNLLLRAAGIPAPDSRRVNSEDHAVEIAHELGFPVVLKPRKGADSDGVFVGLQDERDVRQAFDTAIALQPTIQIEPFIEGREYRATVVDGRVVALLERVPPRVTGDGTHTIQHLIDQMNADPRRGNRIVDPLKTIVVEAKTTRMLERHGLILDSIPATGQTVVLKPTGHISAGGAAIDRTDEVHPDNADLLRQVTRLLDIDVAGIDFIVNGPVSESIWEVGGAIIEVNAGPGYWIHEYPSEGTPRDIGGPIIDMLFPPGSPVRVPIVAVGRSAISTSIVHEVARELTAAGRAVGLAAADGLFVAGTHQRFNDPTEPWAARKILNHPDVEIAVIEVDPQVIIERGLPFDYCDVAVITAESDGAPDGFPPPESVLCRLVDSSGQIILGSDLAALLSIRDSFPGTVHLIEAESNQSSHVRAFATAAVHACQSL